MKGLFESGPGHHSFLSNPFILVKTPVVVYGDDPSGYGFITFSIDSLFEGAAYLGAGSARVLECV